MAASKHFLIEIHTEELPPKTLYLLASCLMQEIIAQLIKLKLQYQEATFFATPRRLAVLIKKLVPKQEDALIERRGPALSAAIDPEGKPTNAAHGFARSCGITFDQCITIKNNQGEWLGHRQVVIGKTVAELMPMIIQQALSALPIAKRMRWGNFNKEFVRPVHSVIMLYGTEVIEAEILNCKTGRLTQGHRFHSKGWISIANPLQYTKRLQAKYVIADFYARKTLIQQQALHIVAAKLPNAKVLIDQSILEENTGLVEWPVILLAQFDQSFLSVPQEVLISAMQDHQRYFPVTDDLGKLLPYFVIVSNIESKNKERLIAGNERVLRARLSDAAFFFAVDKKTKLIDRLEQLKKIIYQADLGSMHDKAERLAFLTAYIVNSSDEKITAQAQRAGLLAKTDLTTDMVREFPELQGTMGYYYALHDNESPNIAKAIIEQYMPRLSGDALPETFLGSALAIADRIDTLVGIFGIDQAPTSDKDPFALRRAALGTLRILIEKKLHLDLTKCLAFSIGTYGEKLSKKDIIQPLLTFIFDRLKPWYQDQNISADVLASVFALKLSEPYDIHRRIQAVQYFKSLPEAEALVVTHKRITHILDKTESSFAKKIDESLFEHEAERILQISLSEKNRVIVNYLQEGNYTAILQQLASLRQPVDNFFDHVMVMTDDQAKRKNRLSLLQELRELFLNVADIALLRSVSKSNETHYS